MKAKHYTTIGNVSYFISEDGSHWKFNHESECWCNIVKAPFEFKDHEPVDYRFLIVLSIIVYTLVNIL